MEFTLIGQFSTKGNLIASDPCYEIDEWCNKHFKVKPGIYDVFVVTGQLVDPLFTWDEDNFRVAELVILHNDYKGSFDFKKMNACIAIDSGQCGFFNKESYGQKSTSPYLQTGETLNFMKNSVSSKKIEIKTNLQTILEKDSNEVYAKLKAECFKGSDEDTCAWFTKQNEFNQSSIDRMMNYLNSGTHPDYLKPKLTTDFYEIMCDLTNQELYAGTLDPYGAVSRSGLGDGGAELFVAKNKDNEIIGAYLSYLSLDDIK